MLPRTTTTRLLSFLLTTCFTRIQPSRSMGTMTECAAAASSGPKDESHVVLNRWSSRWQKNNLGWHIEEPHPTLVQHFPSVLSKLGSNSNKKDKSILVPLCGKTVDLAYLAEHPSIQHVVGVEGIQKAIDEFSQEHPSLQIKAKADVESGGKFDVHEGVNISLLKGDFFELDAPLVPTQVSGQQFDIVWDRASIIAVDPSLRGDYVETLRRVTKPGGIILLCTFDRRAGNPEAMAAGPPYSVNEATVRQLYESQPWVEKVVYLGQKSDTDDERRKDRWAEAGLTEVFEMHFVIHTKPDPAASSL